MTDQAQKPTTMAIAALRTSAGEPEAIAQAQRRTDPATHEIQLGDILGLNFLGIVHELADAPTYERAAENLRVYVDQAARVAVLQAKQEDRNAAKVVLDGLRAMCEAKSLLNERALAHIVALSAQLKTLGEENAKLVTDLSEAVGGSAKERRAAVARDIHVGRRGLPPSERVALMRKLVKFDQDLLAEMEAALAEESTSRQS